MTPLELIGALALGAAIPVALLFALVLWFARGHRVSLEGVRIVRSDEWSTTAKLASYDDEELRRQFRIWQTVAVEDGRGKWRDFSVENKAYPEDTGDSERPPAAVQHGARTREVGGE